MKIIKLFIYGISLIVSIPSFASDDQRNNGIEGCPGGSVPSKDGRFYLPNSNTECNPSQSDIDNNKNNSG